MVISEQATVAGGALREYARGVGLLVRGVAFCARTPRLWGLGLIPVLLTGLLFAVAFTVLLWSLADLSAAVTWFADGWSAGARGLARALAGIAVLGAAVLLGVVIFAAVALTIGAPFYERISERVEQSYGGDPVPESAMGFWRSFIIGLVDSAKLTALAVVVGLGLFLAGFLPALGQTVVPLTGAAFGGWLLALELTAIAFDRRGLRLAARRRALRRYRATTLGFGMAAFVCFLVPGGAVLMMPAAVVGGTLLARRALGLPIAVPPLADQPR